MEYSAGEEVHIFSRAAGSWIEGVVVQVLAEPAHVDGTDMPACAVRVAYNGNMQKWVAPAGFAALLRRKPQGAAQAPPESSPAFRGGAEAAEAEPPPLAEATCGASATATGAEAPSGADDPAGGAAAEAAQEAQNDVPAPRFSEYDSVSVLSRGQGIWYRDGVVLKILDSHGAVEEGADMPAGSIKVVYDSESVVKWIPPHCLDAEVSCLDFEKGDAVSVFCRQMGLWVADGVVVELLPERATVEDGLTLPAGAVKVIYENNKSVKWVPPEMFQCELKRRVTPEKLSRLVDLGLGSKAAGDFLVVGVAGKGEAVNGHYRLVGTYNERPKYQNSRGAIIYFDGYWKINDTSDTLAWRFMVKSATGPEPPTGEWSPHGYICSSSTPPTVHKCG